MFGRGGGRATTHLNNHHCYITRPTGIAFAGAPKKKERDYQNITKDSGVFM